MEFLRKLSEDYESSELNNIDYSIKKAIEYLKIRAIEILNEQLSISILNGDVLKSENLVATFKRIEKPILDKVDLLKDTSEIINAFLEEEENLFSFPGALGKVAGKMSRGDFVAFIAPMKRGKTWWLWTERSLSGRRSISY